MIDSPIPEGDDDIKEVQPLVNKATLEVAIEELLDVLIEEEVCDYVTNRGHELYFGKEEEENLSDSDQIQSEHESVDESTVDIFGQVLGKKTTFEIQCPNCKRTLAAVRFAPHLEKCMGMGRNSSRIASRRLAASASGNVSSTTFASSGDTQRVSPNPNSNGSTAGSTAPSQTVNADIPSEDDHFEEDVDDDEDWTMEKKRRGKRTIEKTNTKNKKGPSTSGGRSRKNELKTKRSASPLMSAYSPTSIDPGDEASNFSTTSSH